VTTRSLPYTRSASTRAGEAPTGLPQIDALTARAGSENFRVASRLLPRRLRTDLMDVYRYARFVDEIGDSYRGDRLEALAWVEAELDRSLSGTESVHPAVGGAAHLVREGRISAEPLLDLIEANRCDQTVSGYGSFNDLLGYCRLSANPVGRLVLELFDASTPERLSWSDSICTGLQLVEHWQDVGEDARAGRIYLPSEDLLSFGVDPSELAQPGEASPALRSLIAFESRRARGLLDAGSPLISSLTGRLKIAVAGFWAGGQATLDALEAHGFDPLSSQLRPRRARVIWRMAKRLAR
jgi:squalene synthase HpnC